MWLLSKTVNVIRARYEVPWGTSCDIVAKEEKRSKLTVAEFEEACQAHYDRLEVYVLLTNSNQKLFGDMMKNLQFSC